MRKSGISRKNFFLDYVREHANNHAEAMEIAKKWAEDDTNDAYKRGELYYLHMDKFRQSLTEKYERYVNKYYEDR